MVPLRIILPLLAFATVAFATNGRVTPVRQLGQYVIHSETGDLAHVPYRNDEPFLNVMRTHFSFPGITIEQAHPILIPTGQNFEEQFLKADINKHLIVFSDIHPPNEMRVAMPIKPATGQALPSYERLLAFLAMKESSLEPGVWIVKLLGIRKVSGVNDFEERLSHHRTYDWDHFRIGKVMTIQEVFNKLREVRPRVP